MVTFLPRLALALTLVFAAGAARAADVRVDTSVDQPPEPVVAAEESSGLRLGFAGSEPGGDPRMGLGADLFLGGGMSLRAEGAFLGNAAGPAAERGAVRGRLAYGGGIESFGIGPGVVTPWVEGQRDWSLDSPGIDGEPTPRTRLSIGLDISAGNAAGLSLSAGAERGGDASDVSANAGMTLRF